jgi:hypothetical protein
MSPPTLIERAYQLARSGLYRGANDVRIALKAEGFEAGAVNTHLQGPLLLRTLNRLCKEARRQQP